MYFNISLIRAVNFFVDVNDPKTTHNYKKNDSLKGFSYQF